MIFISGEVGRDETGKLVAGGSEAETRQTFANLNFALQRAGARLEDVVRITAYVKDLADYGVARERQCRCLGSAARRAHRDRYGGGRRQPLRAMSRRV